MELTTTADALAGTADAKSVPDVTAPKAEEKLDYEAMYKELLKEKDKLKTSFDTTSSDLARVKRELSEHRTKEENEKAEREETERLRTQEIEELRTFKRISGYTTSLLSVPNMSADYAKELAGMLPSDVPDQFFDGIKKFIADETARIRAEALKEQPQMSTGMPLSAKDALSEQDKELRRAFGLI